MKSALQKGLLLTFALSAPHPVAAQFDAVTALFKEVQSIALYGQSAWIDNLDPDGRSNCLFEDLLCGVGTEVLIDLGGARQSRVELGLGASYLGGLTTNTPGLEFRGALRSFPTISVYYNKAIPKFENFEVYTGGSLGVTELFNAQTHDAAGTERDVKGTTFEYGIIGGLYANVRGIGVYAEPSYRWRRFPSLDYTLVPADSGRVGATWPRELNLSGLTVAVGLQFRLKPADPPTSPLQVWTLAQVDARDLPAPVAVTGSETSITQTQIVFGSLTLTSSDTSYVLQVVTRQAVLNADGTILALPGNPDLYEETGKYRVAGGRWQLDPGGPKQGAEAYDITRSGDEFVISDRRTGAMLTFRKPGAGTTSAETGAK